MKKKPNKKKSPHKHERETSRARMSSSSKPKTGGDQLAEPEAAQKAAPSVVDQQCKAAGRHRSGCDCSGAAREAPIA